MTPRPSALISSRALWELRRAGACQAVVLAAQTWAGYCAFLPRDEQTVGRCLDDLRLRVLDLAMIESLEPPP